MENLVATEAIASKLKKHGLDSDLYPQNDGIYIIDHPLDLIAESVRNKEKRLTAIHFVAIGETVNDRSGGVLKRFDVSVKSDAPKVIAATILRTYRRLDRKFANYFREIEAQRPQLFQRLEAAGYFSAPNAPSRDLVRDEQGQMTIKQCREHVREVERFAAKYRRTPPSNMNIAVNAGFEIEGMTARSWIHGMAMTEGVALIRERDGLKREFVVPFAARYHWGRPRLLKQSEVGDF
jgi:hypothetical protein